MYTSPPEFETLINGLIPVAGSKMNARLFVHVELTLTLAMQLGFGDEPLLVGWVLLSRMPLHDERLKRLSPLQRRMLANAAILVPLSSRFAWENALARYFELPSQDRLYVLSETSLNDSQIQLCRQIPCPDEPRERMYVDILSGTLPYEERARRDAEAGETYMVTVRMPTIPGAKRQDRVLRHGHVTIPHTRTDRSSDTSWFRTRRPPTTISLFLSDLRPTAQFLDERELHFKKRPHWVRDLSQIRYRRGIMSGEHLSLDADNAAPLELNGVVHLPGMVSAGKSTLAKLIIAHCVRLGLDVRITLVVGDSHTAVETAHQVNSWFYDDPSGDHVAAVPVLGATQRETHLKRLLVSREYRRCLDEGRPHWGERWLMPACPIAPHIRWEGEQDVIMSAGSEPCEALFSEPRRGRGKGDRHVCPLFHRCPSKQMYRDMAQARLWVTTPGALAHATLPRQLDRRIIHLGDLIYEQSDLVIFDEVETIVDWFDRAFAQHEDLTNGGAGLLDRLDRQISRFWSENRVLPSDFRRWIIAAREAPKALGSILTVLADHEQERVVGAWVGQHHFAPNQLAYRLARRLACLKEWDSNTVPAAERTENERLTGAIFGVFDELLNGIPDPLRRQVPPSPAEVDQVSELARLMQSMNNLADEDVDGSLLRQCRDWIIRHFENIEARLQTFREELRASGTDSDARYLEKHADRTVDDLACRLQFVLTVALLDRHMHIVLREWYNKPDELDTDQPFSKIPRAMRNILPLPLTGAQYGFIVDRVVEQTADVRNKLSLFNYVNIGRSYLLDFHRLREDYEGLPGPHVLALSGTSYLPDSTAFHVALPPRGILLAPENTEAAIRESRFAWRPFRDRRGEPIFISGQPDKDQKLRQLLQSMLRDGGTRGGFVGDVLDQLMLLGSENPVSWNDRSRILMLTNSYKQARTVAQVLRDGWREMASAIFNLRRGTQDEDFEMEQETAPNEIQLVDIEQFAMTGGRVLVAPIQSIGRGFNILNTAEEPKAAFGAVMFLTRLMGHPRDMVAIAQELNRYALAWADNPEFVAWQNDTLYKRALSVREQASRLRRNIDTRQGYREMFNDPVLGVYPRTDLAATTAGRVIQAVGRLLRGGAPFLAYFIDAAWSPVLARTADGDDTECEDTSLLTALINIVGEYAHKDEIGRALYSSFADALAVTEGRDSN